MAAGHDTANGGHPGGSDFSLGSNYDHSNARGNDGYSDSSYSLDNYNYSDAAGNGIGRSNNYGYNSPGSYTNKGTTVSYDGGSNTVSGGFTSSNHNRQGDSFAGGVGVTDNRSGGSYSTDYTVTSIETPPARPAVFTAAPTKVTLETSYGPGDFKLPDAATLDNITMMRPPIGTEISGPYVPDQSLGSVLDLPATTSGVLGHTTGQMVDGPLARPANLPTVENLVMDQVVESIRAQEGAPASAGSATLGYEVPDTVSLFTASKHMPPNGVTPAFDLEALYVAPEVQAQQFPDQLPLETLQTTPDVEGGGVFSQETLQRVPNSIIGNAVIMGSAPYTTALANLAPFKPVGPFIAQAVIGGVVTGRLTTPTIKWATDEAFRAAGQEIYDPLYPGDTFAARNYYDAVPAIPSAAASIGGKMLTTAVVAELFGAGIVATSVGWIGGAILGSAAYVLADAFLGEDDLRPIVQTVNYALDGDFSIGKAVSDSLDVESKTPSVPRTPKEIDGLLDLYNNQDPDFGKPGTTLPDPMTERPEPRPVAPHESKVDVVESVQSRPVTVEPTLDKPAPTKVEKVEIVEINGDYFDFEPSVPDGPKSDIAALPRGGEIPASAVPASSGFPRSDIVTSLPDNTEDGPGIIWPIAERDVSDLPYQVDWDIAALAAPEFSDVLL